MFTMADLERLIIQGDPIAIMGEGRDPVITGDTMYLRGIDDGCEYAEDLEIDVGDKLSLRYRSPGSTEWVDGGSYSSYDDLVGFVYSL